MRLIFMGTPEFAVPSLRAVSEVHEVVAVYTRPDAASGRGTSLVPSPVKVAAADLGLRVEQPPTLRDPQATESLCALSPDAIVVAAYGLMLPPDVLACARLGAINVHASLLPRWRGAAPIQRAILAGDTMTGVSIMRMEEGLDTGPYCLVSEVPLADKYADELTSELAEAGAVAVLEALRRLGTGECRWVAQDEALATYADKVVKGDMALSPSLTAGQALSRIRASTAQAPARVRVGESSMTVLRAEPATQEVSPATVVPGPDGVVLGFREGALLLTEIKPDGKRSMSATEWSRGQRELSSMTWKEPA